MVIPGSQTPKTGSAASDRRLKLIGTLGVGGFALLTLALIIVNLNWRRDAVLGGSHRRAENLAYILAEHLERSVNAVDAAIGQILLQRDRMGGDAASWQLALATARSGLSGVGSLSVTDAAGIIRYSTQPVILGQSRANQYLFRTLRDGSGNKLLADTPFRALNDPGLMLIPFGRRIEGRDGRFEGIVAVTLIPALLRDFYQTVDVGAHGHIRILHPAGVVVFHEPSATAQIGASAKDDPVLRAATAQGPKGRIIGKDADGNTHIVGYAQTAHSGLVVAVAFDRDDVLQGWRRDAAVTAGITLALLLVLMAGSIALFRQLAARRISEAKLIQAQKMEAVGQLTGGIAHDFNNLLTVVLGCADQLALMLRDKGETHRLAMMIVSAGERAASLTRQLLAFSRRQILAPTAVDVNVLVKGMENLLRRSLGEEIEIEFAIDEDISPVTADPAQLETSILNLAINARDAMPGGGKLTIETSVVVLDEQYAAGEREVAPGAYIMIAITDSGMGMSPEVATQAFEPFFTTKPTGKGTGLGLSMVYGFAKQSDGHVKIYSEVGHGTTVKLYLPPNSEPTANTAQRADAGIARTGSETILVVEDDALVADLVTSQLSGLGYRVLTARDGRAALTQLQQDAAIDLLFTDVILPGGMTGRQVAETARQTRPALKVLYTSGYTANSIVHNGRLDPGVRLLQKPYTRHDVATAVRAALDG